MAENENDRSPDMDSSDAPADPTPEPSTPESATPEPSTPESATPSPPDPAPEATPAPEPPPEPEPTPAAEPSPEPEPEPTPEPAAPEPPGDLQATSVPAAKADIANRAVALVIDGLCAFVVGFIPGIGGLVGAAYMLLRDGLELDFMSHRSIGKTVMKLHVDTVDGSPVDIGTSLRRNWMFALGPLAQASLFIPFIGWFVLLPLFTIGALLMAIIEIVLVLTDAEGRRVGDKLAGTVVRSD